MAKVVITSEKDNASSVFDKRFGRAAFFALYDTKSKELSFIENEQADGNSGVGKKVAEKMIGLKVSKIISGDFGPKAKELLNKFNIQLVILDENNATIQEIIDKIK